MTTKLIYIGNGDALIGVPARDLTEDDLRVIEQDEYLKALEVDEAKLLKSGLYEKAKIAEQPKTKAAKEGKS